MEDIKPEKVRSSNSKGRKKEEVAIANLLLGITANQEHRASRLKVQDLQHYKVIASLYTTEVFCFYVETGQCHLFSLSNIFLITIFYASTINLRRANSTSPTYTEIFFIIFVKIRKFATTI